MQSGSDNQRCELHQVINCESCTDTFNKLHRVIQGDDDETLEEFPQEDMEGWLEHQLVFERDTKGKDLMARRDDADDFIVIDPRVKQLHKQQEQKRKKLEGDDVQSRHRVPLQYG